MPRYKPPPPPPGPKVRQHAGGWAVFVGEEVVATFETNGEAWRWLDRNERRLLWARRETADWKGVGTYYATDSKKAKKP